MKRKLGVFKVLDLNGNTQHLISGQYEDEYYMYIRIWSEYGDAKYLRLDNHKPFIFVSESSGNKYYSCKMGSLIKGLIESLFI